MKKSKRNVESVYVVPKILLKIWGQIGRKFNTSTVSFAMTKMTYIQNRHNTGWFTEMLLQRISSYTNSNNICIKVFKNGPSKICGRQTIKQSISLQLF